MLLFGVELIICKFKVVKVYVWLVIGKSKFIVSSEKFMMVDEINGLVFFIVVIVLVMFCMGKELFEWYLNR